MNQASCFFCIRVKYQSMFSIERMGRGYVGRKSEKARA